MKQNSPTPFTAEHEEHSTV